MNVQAALRPGIGPRRGDGEGGVLGVLPRRGDGDVVVPDPRRWCGLVDFLFLALSSPGLGLTRFEGD